MASPFTEEELFSERDETYIDFSAETLFLQEYEDGDDEYILEFEVFIDLGGDEELRRLWPEGEPNTISGQQTFRAPHTKQTTAQIIANLDWRVYQKLEIEPHDQDYNEIDIFKGEHKILVRQRLQNRKIYFKFSRDSDPVLMDTLDLFEALEAAPGAADRVTIRYRVKVKPVAPSTSRGKVKYRPDQADPNKKAILVTGHRKLSDLIAEGRAGGYPG